MASIIKRCDCGDEDWDECPHPWIVRYAGRPGEQAAGGVLRG